jgi:hypothetical protein
MPTEAELFAGPVGAKAKGLGDILSRPGVKQAGGYMFGAWLVDKILKATHERGMRNIQREGLRGQAEMITPENLYFQAAQPQAQAEESQARQALFSQLSGGILGPSLAKGEIMIGQ